MEYIGYTLLTMILYGIAPIVMKTVSGNIETNTAVFFTYTFALAVIAGYTLIIRTPLVFNRFSLYAGLVGVIFVVALFSWYKALITGPLSIVVPIVSLCLVIPVIHGVIFLKEPLSVTKFLGIIFAVIAILLLSK